MPCVDVTTKFKHCFVHKHINMLIIVRILQFIMYIYIVICTLFWPTGRTALTSYTTVSTSHVTNNLFHSYATLFRHWTLFQRAAFRCHGIYVSVDPVNCSHASSCSKSNCLFHRDSLSILFALTTVIFMAREPNI